MNVLLATCSVEEHTREKAVQLNSHYPVGLASIHAYLESQGHNVKTLFLNDFPEDACMGIIAQHVPDYDVLGLQVISHNRVMSYRVIEAFQDRIQIVLGGIHASVMYEQLVRKYPKVTVVIGEGEITLAELLSGSKDLYEIDGIAYNMAGTVVKTPERALISDLDALPFPKHEAFWSEERTVASILTSRGCPFRCSFCSLDVISRRKVRYRSVDSVIAEIQHIKMNCPSLQGIWIHDDSFFLDNDRAISLCERVSQLPFRVGFICSARFKPVSPKLFDAMARAGFKWVLFGLESGCQRVLDRNHKSLKLLDATKAVQMLAETPIHATAFLIVGLPGEDEDSIADTADFVNHLQQIKYMHYEDIGIATVYPGTELCELMKKAGKIDDDYWLTDGPVPYYTVEHDLGTLNRFKDQLLDRIALSRQQ